jgi:hypothetical protein
VLPVLREAVRALSAKQISALLRGVPWPTLTVLDPTDRLDTALRAAALSPEPGDDPHPGLAVAIAPAQSRPLAVLLWRQHEHAPHPQFWYALGAEVAAAGGVADYPSPWPPPPATSAVEPVPPGGEVQA